MAPSSQEVYNPADLTALARIFPRASSYALEDMALRGAFKDINALSDAASLLRKELALPEGAPLDDLLISILLHEQSSEAAKNKAELYKSRRAVESICAALSLGGEYKTLLLNAYASPGSGKFFTAEYSRLSPELDCDFNKPGPKASAIIETLIEEANALSRRNFAQTNRDFLGALFKDKKIPRVLHDDLAAVFCAPCAREIQPLFETLLDDLNKINDNSSQNAALAGMVLLDTITRADALYAAAFSKALKYPLLPEDLQSITLRYQKLKTPAETAEIFEAVLKRLPFADDPLENLGLAARVMRGAQEETLAIAQDAATHRRGKILFMRRLLPDKYLNSAADEITNKFYDQNTVEEVLSMFNHILKELPHGGNPLVNADIALKVLLKKLPLKDAFAQASFRTENKETPIARPAAPGAGAASLENEAFNAYLGTERRDDIIAFFRTRLAPFTFWKEDETKHCYALSILVGELNGAITPAAAALSLDLLQADSPEESVDIILKGLSSKEDLDKAVAFAAYQKFYEAGGGHKDAALRTVNMLQ